MTQSIRSYSVCAHGIGLSDQEPGDFTEHALDSLAGPNDKATSEGDVDWLLDLVINGLPPDDSDNAVVEETG